MGNFARVPVDESQDQPAALRISLDASAKIAVVPNIYIGLFASLNTTATAGSGDSSWASTNVGGEAKVYAMMTPRLEAEANFKFATAVGATEPLDPLDASFCSSALLGCTATCLQNHDTALDSQIALRMSAGYKLYASSSFGSWSAEIGSDDITPLNVSHLGWVTPLGAWCYYLFPPAPSSSPASPQPSSASPPLLPPPPPLPFSSPPPVEMFCPESWYTGSPPKILDGTMCPVLAGDCMCNGCRWHSGLGRCQCDPSLNGQCSNPFPSPPSPPSPLSSPAPPPIGGGCVPIAGRRLSEHNSASETVDDPTTEEIDRLRAIVPGYDELCASVQRVLVWMVQSAWDVEQMPNFVEAIGENRFDDAALISERAVACQGSTCSGHMQLLRTGCPLLPRWTSTPFWLNTLSSFRASNPRFEAGAWERILTGGPHGGIPSPEWWKMDLVVDIELVIVGTVSCGSLNVSNNSLDVSMQLREPGLRLPLYSSQPSANLSEAAAATAAAGLYLDKLGLLQFRSGTPRWWDEHALLRVAPVDLSHVNITHECLFGGADGNGLVDAPNGSLAFEEVGPGGSPHDTDYSADHTRIAAQLGEPSLPLPFRSLHSGDCASTCPKGYALQPLESTARDGDGILWNVADASTTDRGRAKYENASGTLMDCVHYHAVDYRACTVSKRDADRAFLDCAADRVNETQWAEMGVSAPSSVHSSQITTWWYSVMVSAPALDLLALDSSLYLAAFVPPPFSPPPSSPPSLPEESSGSGSGEAGSGSGEAGSGSGGVDTFGPAAAMMQIPGRRLSESGPDWSMHPDWAVLRTEFDCATFVRSREGCGCQAQTGTAALMSATTGASGWPTGSTTFGCLSAGVGDDSGAANNASDVHTVKDRLITLGYPMSTSQPDRDRALSLFLCATAGVGSFEEGCDLSNYKGCTVNGTSCPADLVTTYRTCRLANVSCTRGVQPFSTGHEWLRSRDAPRWVQLPQSGVGFARTHSSALVAYGTAWLSRALVTAGRTYADAWLRSHPDHPPILVEGASTRGGGFAPGYDADMQTGLKMAITRPDSREVEEAQVAALRGAGLNVTSASSYFSATFVVPAPAYQKKVPLIRQAIASLSGPNLSLVLEGSELGDQKQNKSWSDVVALAIGRHNLQGACALLSANATRINAECVLTPGVVAGRLSLTTASGGRSDSCARIRVSVARASSGAGRRLQTSLPAPPPLAVGPAPPPPAYMDDLVTGFGALNRIDDEASVAEEPMEVACARVSTVFDKATTFVYNYLDGDESRASDPDVERVAEMEMDFRSLDGSNGRVQRCLRAYDIGASLHATVTLPSNESSKAVLRLSRTLSGLHRKMTTSLRTNTAANRAASLSMVQLAVNQIDAISDLPVDALQWASAAGRFKSLLGAQVNPTIVSAIEGVCTFAGGARSLSNNARARLPDPSWMREKIGTLRSVIDTMSGFLEYVRQGVPEQVERVKALLIQKMRDTAGQVQGMLLNSLMESMTRVSFLGGQVNMSETSSGVHGMLTSLPSSRAQLASAVSGGLVRLLDRFGLRERLMNVSQLVLDVTT